ncbi:MAG: LUD domain-containing protein [Gammaproteobacteria bacterium]|nr:LUD domain-containing protein [Gammaproteobacteria bacterium]MBU1646940.1 LUD domain-containing protein [Gammaproteobacteria bacterium]MBU1972452.1 LUD domain-containing protein [Gammaproteobacteria bacterium]
MNDSRDLILGRIRERLGRSAANAPTAGAAVDAALAAHSASPRPPPDVDLVAAFRTRSEALSSTVDEVAVLADVPRAVAAYLAEHKIDPRAVCVPEIKGLDWRGAGIEVEARAAVDHDLVGITGCFRAIAETGTLMLCTAPATPATVSLLPETHIAVVAAPTILASMEEAWAAARAEFGQLPRAVNFISGPSRTGDIEQTIVLGAHGPYRVHVIVVRAA